jgi:type I restriction enzyme M protein
MRGVQKCTCAGASLRGRNSAPLCCIKLDTATDPACGSGGMFMQGAELVKSKQGNLNGINIYGQEKEPAT